MFHVSASSEKVNKYYSYAFMFIREHDSKTPTPQTTFVRLPWRTDNLAITGWTTHKKFVPETMDFDVAVVNLAAPVDLDMFGACLVCLPDGTEVLSTLRVVSSGKTIIKIQ